MPQYKPKSQFAIHSISLRDTKVGYQKSHVDMTPDDGTTSIAGLIDLYCRSATAHLSESSRVSRQNQLRKFLRWLELYTSDEMQRNKGKGLSLALIDKRDIEKYYEWLSTTKAVFPNDLPADEAEAEYNKMAEKEKAKHGENPDSIYYHKTSDEIKQIIKYSIKPLHPMTQYAYFTAVRSFFDWIDRKDYGKNIAEKIKPRQERTFDQQNVFHEHFTEEQQNEMYRFFEGRLRDQTIYTTLIKTGCREVELAEATIDSIKQAPDVNGNMVPVLYIRSKGSFTVKNMVQLPPKAYEKIQKYLTECRPGAAPSEPLFTSSSIRSRKKNEKGEIKYGAISTRAIRALMREAIIAIGLGDDKRYNVHGLRRTFAYNARKAGMSEYDLQQRLRQANIKTTRLYTRSFDTAIMLADPNVIKMDNALGF